jgi:hypothetical protein
MAGTAKSGLAAMRLPNDWTEVTLPDANPYDGSRLGPFLPLASA